MIHAQQLPALPFLLGSVGLITLPHWWTMPLSVIGFFYCLLLWRVLGLWQARWLPNKVLLFVLTGCGVMILYQQHLGIFGRNAGTSIFIVALGLKLLEIKSVRDIYFIVYLSFIVAATLLLFEQAMVMAVYLIAVCCCLLATLIVCNLRQVVVKKALQTAMILLLQGLPLGLTFFFLFPRLEAPHWSFLQDKPQVQSGLSETLEPGAISDLALSDALVFRVKFNDALPPQPQRYWRGPVFSYTDGKKWLPLPKRISKLDQTSLEVKGQPYRYTILMEPQEKNWVFAMDMPAALSNPLNINHLYQVTTEANPAVRAEYPLESYTDYNTGELNNTEREENLQLPATVDPHINALVQQLHGFDSTPAAYIQAVMQHFRTQQFYYSLTPPLMEDNPIATFLFKTRTGFCSHYATAFVYLMRIANIPARVVSGYQGGEHNPLGNFLEIRQADAHAWTEVWLDNLGWTRVDPTVAVAPERVRNGVNVSQQVDSGLIQFDVGTHGNTAAQLARQLRQAWQHADYSWQRWVINYNTNNQSRFLAAFGILNSRSMLQWLFGVIALLIMGLFWWLTRQPKVNRDQAELLYQQFTRKLSKLQLYKQPSETANAFALRVAQHHTELTSPVMHITALYLAMRYGKERPADGLVQLKRHIKALAVHRSKPPKTPGTNETP